MSILAIHRTFITPLDRSQILDLITALDDTIDLMRDTRRRMLRYGVAFTSEMQAMADCAARATTIIRDAMPMLGAISRSAQALGALSVALRGIEGEADEQLDRGLRTVFASEHSPGRELSVEKVYDLVEAVVERSEDIVVEQV